MKSPPAGDKFARCHKCLFETRYYRREPARRKNGLSVRGGAMRVAGLLFALALTPLSVSAQTAPPIAYHYAWAPKPVRPTPYAAPNRPHWKLSELLAAHGHGKSWSEVVVQDAGYTGKYIQLAAGEKDPTLFYPDNPMFWIVQAGQMRVSIEGQEPFVASKGFIVQVPQRTPFAIETIGNQPSLRFEVTRAGALPLYPLDETPPPAPPGRKYVKVAYANGGGYAPGEKPYLDFIGEVVQGGKTPPNFVKDGPYLRQLSIPTPPDNDLGHYHVGYDEFWFILEGQIDYQIEGVPPFRADQGDVVLASHGRWHRSTPAGTGMATRLAVFPAGGTSLLEGDNPSKAQPR
jgi:mannose-6-phosphate isomerase-like protein (cupin superfamily)